MTESQMNLPQVVSRDEWLPARSCWPRRREPLPECSAYGEEIGTEYLARSLGGRRDDA